MLVTFPNSEHTLSARTTATQASLEVQTPRHSSRLAASGSESRLRKVLVLLVRTAPPKR